MGGAPEVARMLSLYRPPAYIGGCTQVTLSGPHPTLIRNYDYHPGTFEGRFLLGRWTKTSVLATSDCGWGALDGINEHGLVVALAFGGRPEVGEGFGIPIILRYVLETCRNVGDAVTTLVRLPSHMSYNVSVLDVTGAHAVVRLAPDRPPSVSEDPIATNHQGQPEWPRYEGSSKSLEREASLRADLERYHHDPEGLLGRFLAPPLFSTTYDRGFGTLYTAAYSPRTLAVDYRWRTQRQTQTIASFVEKELLVDLTP
jgi:predicted choloylglycine hydrolase